MSDLQTLAAEFKKWKGDLSYRRYPDHLWHKVHQLTQKHSIQEIAEALGISVQYLKRKFTKRGAPITFAPIQLASLPSLVKIEFKQISLHSDSEHAISVIQTLLRGV